MPHFDRFDVDVVVDGVAQPKYDVVADNQTNTVTCWIKSEAGKAFSVRWKQLSPSASSHPIGGYVYVDGVYVSGRYMDAHKVGFALEVADTLVSQTVARPLIFSTLELTDDDDCLHSSNAKYLGDICLELWNVSVGGSAPITVVSTLDQKVHEKVKKGMAHRVTFGEGKNIPPRPVHEAKKINCLATFIFKYRSIDILRADGVAPPDPSSQKSEAEKRKADTMEDEEDDLEDDDGDEERAEAELKALLERANQIQSELAKKASKSKSKKRKKVKTEERLALISGEVIDLT